jgi:hypothetical protein
LKSIEEIILSRRERLNTVKKKPSKKLEKYKVIVEKAMELNTDTAWKTALNKLIALKIPPEDLYCVGSKIAHYTLNNRDSESYRILDRLLKDQEFGFKQLMIELGLIKEED